MAGGLFAVYRDTTTVQTVQDTSRRAKEVSFNNNNNQVHPLRSAKEGFAVFRDTGRGLNGTQEKENINPGGKGAKRAGLSAKGKSSGCGDSKSNECARTSTKGKSAMGERVANRASKPTAMSTNGICTGTLRTRELPPLPPLESDSMEARPIRLSKEPTEIVPSAVEIPQYESPLPSLARSRIPGSPASTVDSGYGKVSDGDLELDTGLDLKDESDMSFDVDATELNRRARALTESPLAEITQAFTGLGRFSNAVPASPSPTLNRPIISHRHRASPSKPVSALPPRLRPYSTTATTRKIKAGQTSAEAPKPAPSAMNSRSLRF